MMTRPTWTSWQRNACQHLSRTKARALQNSQFTNGRRLHPLDFGQNLPVRLRNLLSLLIDRWTSRSRLSRQRSEDRLTAIHPGIMESHNSIAENNQEPAEDDADRARERRPLGTGYQNSQQDLRRSQSKIGRHPTPPRRWNRQSQNNPRLKSSISPRSQRRRFCTQWSRADLALKRRRRSQKPNERLWRPGQRTTHGEL